MNRQELVSVIITTYNRPFCIIKRAIDSVMEQDYPNIEIIVVNDTDGRSFFYNQLNSKMANYKNVIYISDGINRGACKARNIGLERATGTYVAFLDDDDIWNKSKISKQMKCLQEGDSMVTCRTIRVIKNGKQKKSVRLPKIITERHLFQKNFCNGTSCPLIRKDLLQSIGGFDETMPALQDYDCWLRLIKEGKIRTINEPLVTIYMDSLNRISDNSRKRIGALKTIKAKYELVAPQKKEFISMININLLREYKKLNDKENYRNQLKVIQKNFCFSPFQIINFLYVLCRG